MEFTLSTTNVRIHGASRTGKTNILRGMVKRSISDGVPVVLIDRYKASIWSYDFPAAAVQVCPDAKTAMDALSAVADSSVPWLVVVDEFWSDHELFRDEAAQETVARIEALSDLHQIVVAGLRLPTWRCGVRDAIVCFRGEKGEFLAKNVERHSDGVRLISPTLTDGLVVPEF
jgi:hypothetical protein